MNYNKNDCSDGYIPLSTYRFLRKFLGTIKIQRSSNDRTLKLLSPQGLRRMFTPAMKNPFFIVGSPRSGTSILGSIINAVPNVSYYREPPIVKYYAKHICERKVSRLRQILFFRLIYGALYHFAATSGIKFFEKNPGNAFITRNLLSIYPTSKFIHIVRDGRDVALSLMAKPWHLQSSLGSTTRGHEGYLHGPYPHYFIEKERRQEFLTTSDIHRCIWIWKRHVNEVLKLEEEMGDDVVLRIKYEDMITDPDVIIEKLLDYIGENNTETIKSIQPIIQSLHPVSLFKWRQVLSADDIDIINKEAGDTLNYLGYPEA